MSAAELSHHAARRARGIPTPSVLVGLVGIAAAQWSRWTGGGTVFCDDVEPGSTISSWLDRCPDLRTLARSRLGIGHHPGGLELALARDRALEPLPDPVLATTLR